MTCIDPYFQNAPGSEITRGYGCDFRADGGATGKVEFRDAYIYDGSGPMATGDGMSLSRVGTCTLNPGVTGKTEMASPLIRCALPDGQMNGYITFVDAYLSSDLPVTAPVNEGPQVNVTADIFIGCLLVLCFIGGWIAGAQR
jgi:hypothetical protein